MTRKRLPANSDAQAQATRDALGTVVSHLEMEMLAAIPDLAAHNIGEYIAAVNRAMLHGVLAPGVGKIMLYGAQLYMAAQPPAHPPPPALHDGSRFVRNVPDKRYKAQPPPTIEGATE